MSTICCFFNIPLSELSSNKDDYTDTKAIITTNIGVQDFDALWIPFKLNTYMENIKISTGTASRMS